MSRTSPGPPARLLPTLPTTARPGETVRLRIAILDPRGNAGVPFAGAVAISVPASLGLAYSVFPYVVLGWLTIWEAAAHPSALKVVLIGALVVLPFLVGYTVFAYRVFRGKAKAGLYGH